MSDRAGAPVCSRFDSVHVLHAAGRFRIPLLARRVPWASTIMQHLTVVCVGPHCNSCVFAETDRICHRTKSLCVSLNSMVWCPAGKEHGPHQTYTAAQLLKLQKKDLQVHPTLLLQTRYRVMCSYKLAFISLQQLSCRLSELLCKL